VWDGFGEFEENNINILSFDINVQQLATREER
jgi:hypothetical protein